MSTAACASIARRQQMLRTDGRPRCSLTNPQEYDGGELLIETPSAATA